MTEELRDDMPPFLTRGCILAAEIYTRNFYFNKKKVSRLSLTEWKNFTNAGMITPIRSLHPKLTRIPVKKSLKTLTTDMPGYTDIVNDSGKWLNRLEKYYKKIKKKYGDCTRFTVDIN